MTDTRQPLAPARASALGRFEGLRTFLLLVPPMLWLGVAYLTALGALFITSFWSQDDFTGQIVRVWSLENYQTIWDVSVYHTITFRTIGLAAALPMLLLGSPIGAAEAEQLGLVDGVLTPAEAEAGVARFLASPPERQARPWPPPEAVAALAEARLRLGEQEGLQLLLGDVAQREQARIERLDAEGDALVALGLDLDLQHDLVHVLADALGADIDLHVHLRLALPLVDDGRVRVLERQVLHILRDHADLRTLAEILAVRHGAFGSVERRSRSHGAGYPC